MLLWEMIFIFFILLIFWSFSFSTLNLLTLGLYSELIVIIFVILCLTFGVYWNITLLFSVAYLFLILGGLELALNILLLLL